MDFVRTTSFGACATVALLAACSEEALEADAPDATEAPVLPDAATNADARPDVRASTDVVSTDASPDAGLIDTGIDPDAGVDPMLLLSRRFIVEVDVDTLRTLVQPGAVVMNGYRVFEIDVRSSGRVARATVTVPLVDGPKHVILHAPGTTGVADVCGVVGTDLGLGLAGLYGARGHIGVAIDYPGLGTPGDHAYLVGDVAGTAILDVLNAISEFADAEGVALTGRSAVTGLSQGGYAALAAAARLPDHPVALDVRGIGVVGPASAWLEHWQPGLTFAGDQVVYHALLVWSWRRHFPAGTSSPWQATVEPRIEGWMEQRCAFPPTGAPAEILQDVLGLEPTGIFDAQLLTAFASGDFAAYPALGQGFRENRLGAIESDVPIVIYQGDDDLVVPESFTTALVQELRSPTAHIDYRIVPGGTHTNVAFGFLAFPQLRTEESIAWLESRLDD